AEERGDGLEVGALVGEAPGARDAEVVAAEVGPEAGRGARLGPGAADRRVAPGREHGPGGAGAEGPQDRDGARAQGHDDGAALRGVGEEFGLEVQLVPVEGEHDGEAHAELEQELDPLALGLGEGGEEGGLARGRERLPWAPGLLEARDPEPATPARAGAGRVVAVAEPSLLLAPAEEGREGGELAVDRRPAHRRRRRIPVGPARPTPEGRHGRAPRPVGLDVGHGQALERPRAPAGDHEREPPPGPPRVDVVALDDGQIPAGRRGEVGGADLAGRQRPELGPALDLGVVSGPPGAESALAEVAPAVREAVVPGARPTPLVGPHQPSAARSASTAAQRRPRARVRQAPNAEAARTLGVVDNLARDKGTAEDAAAFFQEYGLGERQLRAL